MRTTFLIASTLISAGLFSATTVWADDLNLDKLGTPQTELNPQPLPPGKAPSGPGISPAQVDYFNKTTNTATGGSGAGKVMDDLNPQPLPPGFKSPTSTELNPQPLPPGRALNPQPLPPGMKAH